MRRNPAPIQITRVATRGEDRFFYREHGRKFAVAPPLALRGAATGALRIRTEGDQRCAPRAT